MQFVDSLQPDGTLERSPAELVLLFSGEKSISCETRHMSSSEDRGIRNEQKRAKRERKGVKL